MRCHVFLRLVRPYGPETDLLVRQLRDALGADIEIDDRGGALRVAITASDGDAAQRLVRASLAVYRGWEAYVEPAASEALAVAFDSDDAPASAAAGCDRDERHTPAVPERERHAHASGAAT